MILPLGKNTIKTYNSDFLEILPTLASGSIDLVICDLPYNQTICKWDKAVIDLSALWKQLLRIGKLNCAFIFFCTTKFGFKLIESNTKLFRYDLVWEKNYSTGYLHAKKNPLRNHEMIYVFFRRCPTYNPQMTPGKPYRSCSNVLGKTLYRNMKPTQTVNLTGDRYPVSVQKIRSNRNKKHQTEKPQDLLEWLIKTYSNEGETVLDPTMGSGSCGLACKTTGRNFIGIEVDKDIFDNGYLTTT
jgi:site-specific DNA-methyltransferase (adenine-specific)